MLRDCAFEGLHLLQRMSQKLMKGRQLLEFGESSLKSSLWILPPAHSTGVN